jgi:TP901 family phage tail tape measure protein
MANSLFDLFIRVSAQDAASSVLGNIQNKVSTLSGRMANFGLSAAGLQTMASSLADVSGKFTEYEADLAAVSAITGQTGKELQKIGGDARQLAKDFGGSASDNLKSFQGILSKFGVDQFKAAPDALATIARNINTLSAASGDSAAKSMDTLANAMLQMGVNTDNASIAAKTSSDYINILAASAQVGSAEIPQVGAAILQAGVAAKSVNMSFLETNTALQVLGRGGKYGSEAGIALRNVMNLMIKASEPAEAAMANLGTSSGELGKLLTDPSKGLNAAMKKLQEGMKRLPSDAERASTWAQIFGAENAAAAGILRDNTGTYDQYRIAIKKVADEGSAYSQAATRMNTSATFASRGQAYFNDMLISGGAAIGKYGTAAISTFNSIVPTLTGIAGIKQLIPPEAFSSFKNGLVAIKDGAPRVFLSVANSAGNALFSMQRSLAGGLSAMGGAVGSFGAMLRGASLGGMWSGITSGSAQALSVMRSGLTSGIGMLTQFGGAQVAALRAISLFSSGISGFASTIGGSLMTGLRSAVTGVMSMNAAFLTSPVLWIAIAIAGAAFLIYKNWGAISGYFSGLFENIKAAAGGFMDGLSAAFAAPWAILQEVGAAFKPIFDAVSALFTPISAVSGAAGGAGKQFAWMRDVGVVAGQYLGTAFRVIVTPILYIIKLVGETIGIITGLTTSGSAMAMVLAGAFTAIVAPIQLVMNGVWQLFQFIQAIFSGTSLKEAGVNMIMGLWDGIKATWDKLVGGVKSLVGGFTSLFTGKKEEPAKAAAPPKPEEKAAAPKPQIAAPKIAMPRTPPPPQFAAPTIKSDSRGQALVTAKPVNAPNKAAAPSRPSAAAPPPEDSEKVLSSAGSFDVVRMFGPQKGAEMAAEIYKKTQYSLGRGSVAEADSSVKITEKSSADDLLKFLGTKNGNTMSKKLLENKTFVSSEESKAMAASAFSDGDAAKAKGVEQKQAAKAAGKSAKQAAKDDSKALSKKTSAPASTPPEGNAPVNVAPKFSLDAMPNLSSLLSLPQSLDISGIARDIIPPLVQSTAASMPLPTLPTPFAPSQSSKEVVVTFTVNLNISPQQNSQGSTEREAQTIAEEVQKALSKMPAELSRAVEEALQRDRRLQFSGF